MGHWVQGVKENWAGQNPTPMKLKKWWLNFQAVQLLAKECKGNTYFCRTGSSATWATPSPKWFHPRGCTTVWKWEGWRKAALILHSLGCQGGFLLGYFQAFSHWLKCSDWENDFPGQFPLHSSADQLCSDRDTRVAHEPLLSINVLLQQSRLTFFVLKTAFIHSNMIFDFFHQNVTVVKILHVTLYEPFSSSWSTTHPIIFNYI